MGKRGLGRGLAALIAEAGDAPPAGIEEIAVERISANPYQPRTLFDPIKQEELAASIREHGLLQPVLVRRIPATGRYELVAGERRFRAAQAAGLAAVPALVRDCTNREQLELAIVENVQREDIGVIEAARAYRRMQDEFSMSQDAIATRVGMSRSSIANTMRLLRLPDAVQESIERGEISEGHGRALLMADGEGAIISAWQVVTRRGLSVREAEKLARGMRDGAQGPVRTMEPPRAPGRENDPNASAAVEALQQALGTKVQLRREGRGAGRIEIEFYSPDDLIRIVDTLLGEGARR